MSVNVLFFQEHDFNGRFDAKVPRFEAVLQLKKAGLNVAFLSTTLKRSEDLKEHIEFIRSQISRDIDITINNIARYSDRSNGSVEKITPEQVKLFHENPETFLKYMDKNFVELSTFISKLSQLLDGLKIRVQRMSAYNEMLRLGINIVGLSSDFLDAQLEAIQNDYIPGVAKRIADAHSVQELTSMANSIQAQVENFQKDSSKNSIVIVEADHCISPRLESYFLCSEAAKTRLAKAPITVATIDLRVQEYGSFNPVPFVLSRGTKAIIEKMKENDDATINAFSANYKVKALPYVVSESRVILCTALDDIVKNLVRNGVLPFSSVPEASFLGFSPASQHAAAAAGKVVNDENVGDVLRTIEAGVSAGAGASAGPGAF